MTVTRAEGYSITIPSIIMAMHVVNHENILVDGIVSMVVAVVFMISGLILYDGLKGE